MMMLFLPAISSPRMAAVFAFNAAVLRRIARPVASFTPRPMMATGSSAACAALNTMNPVAMIGSHVASWSRWSARNPTTTPNTFRVSVAVPPAAPTRSSSAGPMWVRTANIFDPMSRSVVNTMASLP